MQPALRTLAASADWPDLSGVRPWDYTLGGGGRYLVDERIRCLPANPVMLEIGCFLCASARRWLTVRDDLTVVGLDPWDEKALIDQCRRFQGRPALTRAYPDPDTQANFVSDIERNGAYATALANVAEFRDRFIPVRGRSPAALEDLAARGLAPNLIYIDADKKPDDLSESHRLWPRAQLTGDDWHWGRTKGYPVRRIVESFAAEHGFTVRADHATWVLDQ